MKIFNIALASAILALPQLSCAGGGAAVHKYWVCGVTTYHSVVGGKSQQGKCQANTAYSNPPCREFMVEYDGANGIRPGVPYTQDLAGGSTRIEINKENGQYAYNHTVEKSGDKWVYLGNCNYFEAPVSDKVHMDFGLKTGL